MAALNLPSRATYEVHEQVQVDTQDHEDHTFCGIMFPVKCKKVLPVERLIIHALAVRGELGPLTVWVSREEESPDEQGRYQFRLSPRRWIKIYEKVHERSPRRYQTLDLSACPIVLRPGQVRAIYIHSTLPGDEAIVYDNSLHQAHRLAGWRRVRPVPAHHATTTAARYEDDLLAIYSGKAHLSPVPFGQTPIWGWGNAWRDHREFVGTLAYGTVYQLWRPTLYGAFGSRFQEAVQMLLLLQRAPDSPVSRLPDECLYYILNMCRWDWFADCSQGMKTWQRTVRRQRRRRRQQQAQLEQQQLLNAPAAAAAVAALTATAVASGGCDGAAPVPCCQSRAQASTTQNDMQEDEEEDDEEVHEHEVQDEDDEEDEDDSDFHDAGEEEEDVMHEDNDEDDDDEEEAGEEYHPMDVLENMAQAEQVLAVVAAAVLQAQQEAAAPRRGNEARLNNQNEDDEEEDEDDDEDDNSNESAWEQDNGYRADGRILLYQDYSSPDEEEEDDDGDEEDDSDEAQADDTRGAEVQVVSHRSSWFRRQFARIHVLQALAPRAARRVDPPAHRRRIHNDDDDDDDDEEEDDEPMNLAP